MQTPEFKLDEQAVLRPLRPDDAKRLYELVRNNRAAGEWLPWIASASAPDFAYLAKNALTPEPGQRTIFGIFIDATLADKLNLTHKRNLLNPEWEAWDISWPVTRPDEASPREPVALLSIMPLLQCISPGWKFMLGQRTYGTSTSLNGWAFATKGRASELTVKFYIR